MFENNNKTYFEASDFEEAVEDCKTIINGLYNPTLIAPYRGALPLGVRLSNECDLKLNIIDFQRYDGDTKEPTLIKNDNIAVNETLFLIDDIADEGVTISKCLEYLKKEYPLNKIKVYTIFGNKKHPKEWNYTYEHKGQWIQFIPWEGM